MRRGCRSADRRYRARFGTTPGPTGGRTAARGRTPPRAGSRDRPGPMSRPASEQDRGGDQNCIWGFFFVGRPGHTPLSNGARPTSTHRGRRRGRRHGGGQEHDVVGVHGRCPAGRERCRGRACPVGGIRRQQRHAAGLRRDGEERRRPKRSSGTGAGGGHPAAAGAGRGHRSAAVRLVLESTDGPG